MQVVKVKAPAHFAGFCVALNEPFYFLNGVFFLVQWRNAEAARTFCADNGVRPCDLERMTFETADVFYSSRRFFEHTPETKQMEALEALEAEALAAYRRDLSEYGRLDMSREAYIADYIETHKNA